MGDLKTAIDLHIWNTALGSALHSPVQNTELLLRNACNVQLAALYGAPDWFNHFPATVVDPHYDYLNREVRKVQNRLRQSGRNVNHPPCVVAGLNFGFWVALFESRLHRDLWTPALHRAFPNRPAGWNRANIWSALDAIRRLRNRIAHHEPIFHKNLSVAHTQILEVAEAICPHASDWISYHSNFQEVLNDQPDLSTTARYSLNYSRIFNTI